MTISFFFLREDGMTISNSPFLVDVCQKHKIRTFGEILYPLMSLDKHTRQHVEKIFLRRNPLNFALKHRFAAQNILRPMTVDRDREPKFEVTLGSMGYI
jgi:hypothetical protein